MKAILIAAATSGAGKTTLTLALLTALRRAGHAPRSLKLGPDYIDPAFHAAATGRDAMNLDPWAMSPDLQSQLLSGDSPLIIESAMGLFDGAGLAGAGSAAEVARRFDLPILLIVDCARAAHSVPALVEGITQHKPGLRFHGLILNNVGSDRHAALLHAAFARSNCPRVLATLSRDPTLALPSRHLGLVQAAETDALETRLQAMADWLTAAVSPETLLAEAPDPQPTGAKLTPPAQRIAIAKDAVFSFTYPHLLTQWRSMGAEIRPFSPMANELAPDADLIILPGGYPELHAGQIATNKTFLNSLRNAAEHTDIYGECGGYMVLGDSLTDADGTRHQMAGLLSVDTSFATRKLTLGYRTVNATKGPFAGTHAAHEFHYSTVTREEGTPLFTATDADDTPLPPMGLIQGRVSGSYAHIIAQKPPLSS
ncbi:MAG: cobyrinate a,c-diamide synthase [Pseudomonadota bacterium]